MEPGEELSYDYAYVLDERHTPAAKKKISVQLRLGEMQGDYTREEKVIPHQWRSDDSLDCLLSARGIAGFGCVQ